MGTFDVHPRSLSYLLNTIDQRELGLPDFQRSFVWDPKATESLLESITMGYPAGSLLFIKYKSDLFAIREFEEAPPFDGQAPNLVVLDGQQRLTSLYQALTGKGEYRYFVAMEPLFGGSIEEAVFHEPAARAKKLKLGEIETQARDLILPIPKLFEANGFGRWRDQVLKRRSDEDLGERLWEMNDLWLDNIQSYEFPAVTLSETTPLEAVCNIFETLNSTGVRLTVFELLTARFWPHGIDLRGHWIEARNRHPELDGFDLDPYYILQAVALRAGIPECTRSSILELEPGQVREHWEPASAGMASALRFFKEECGVVRGRWLPYEPMVIPVGAIWPEEVQAVSGPEQISRRNKLARWYWCNTLGQAYESTTNTKAAQDFRNLPRWLSGGEPPTSVSGFTFDTDLREVTHRQRALYRAILGLIVRSGARDFHNGERATWNKVEADEINDHHVFPQAWLRDNAPEVTDRLRDCVLNRVLIDKLTNIRIGKRAPSDYLGEISREIGETAIEDIFDSHMLTSGLDNPLAADDFDRFLSTRSELILEAVRGATGE